MGNLTFLYPLVLLCKAAWWKKKSPNPSFEEGDYDQEPILSHFTGFRLKKNGIKTTFHCLTTDCQGSQI